MDKQELKKILDDYKMDNLGQNKLLAQHINDWFVPKYLMEYGAPRTKECFCNAGSYNKYLKEFNLWFEDFITQE